MVRNLALPWAAGQQGALGPAIGSVMLFLPLVPLLPGLSVKNSGGQRQDLVGTQTHWGSWSPFPGCGSHLPSLLAPRMAYGLDGALGLSAAATCCLLAGGECTPSRPLLEPPAQVLLPLTEPVVSVLRPHAGTLLPWRQPLVDVTLRYALVA